MNDYDSSYSRIPDPRYEEEMHSFGLSLALQPRPTRGCLLDSLCARVQARGELKREVLTYKYP